MPTGPIRREDTAKDKALAGRDGRLLKIAVAIATAAAAGGCASMGDDGGAPCSGAPGLEESLDGCGLTTFLSTLDSSPKDRDDRRKRPEPATINRAAVLPELSESAPAFTASIPKKEAAPLESAARREKGDKKAPASQSVSLNEAVAIAVLSHPAMGAQAAKVQSTVADVHGAEAAMNPSMEIFSGSGGSTFGNYKNYPYPFANVYAPGTSRTDVGFTFRQLVYDFGAAESEVSRNHALADAERLKLADQAEDIALRTANAYLNLLEQRELLAQVEKTLASQRQLVQLVKLNEQNGNGTQADVSRIDARVAETENIRTEIKTAYQIALDEFHRLTNLEPGHLGRPRSVALDVPKNAQDALDLARQSNPSLLALAASGDSFKHALDELDAQSLPRLELQGDSLVRHYMGSSTSALGVIDARAMLTISYKLMDGGLLQSQVERIAANQKANEFRQLDEKETIELNLRRFYQSMSAGRIRHADAVKGVATANKAYSLYIEQFKAGRRTIFEVLDSNMTVFNLEKTRIAGEFEELRSQYAILRHMGRLRKTGDRRRLGDDAGVRQTPGDVDETLEGPRRHARRIDGVDHIVVRRPIDVRRVLLDIEGRVRVRPGDRGGAANVLPAAGQGDHRLLGDAQQHDVEIGGLDVAVAVAIAMVVAGEGGGRRRGLVRRRRARRRRRHIVRDDGEPRRLVVRIFRRLLEIGDARLLRRAGGGRGRRRRRRRGGRGLVAKAAVLVGAVRNRLRIEIVDQPQVADAGEKLLRVLGAVGEGDLSPGGADQIEGETRQHDAAAIGKGEHDVDILHDDFCVGGGEVEFEIGPGGRLAHRDGARRGPLDDHLRPRGARHGGRRHRCSRADVPRARHG
jgi:outer membrane protein, adhesin transport system